MHSEILLQPKEEIVAAKRADTDDEKIATTTDSESHEQSTDGLSHQISRLKAANSPPLSVSPNDTIEKAITLMRMNDYSELPVMTMPRAVSGLFSWRSLGEAAVSERECTEVRHCMHEAREIPETRSIFDAIAEVSKHDCILVRGGDNAIKGIVTAADISEEFKRLTEPFLIIGDIENHLRHLIDGAGFTDDEYQTAKDPRDETRVINDASDMTFGEYSRLLGTDENWRKLKINLDRKEFIKQLDQIRFIRNEVMHFDPDDFNSDQLEDLRSFSKFLRGLVTSIHGK